MANIQFFKVATLPGSLAPNAFYYVRSGDHAEAYLTDALGNPFPIGNSALIAALVEQAIADLPPAPGGLQIVATILDRDTLAPNIHQPTLFLVQDAAGDPTVDAGSALYAWDNTTASFTKVSEEDSLDLNLGTMAQQDANTVNISGGDVANVVMQNAVMDAGHF